MTVGELKEHLAQFEDHLPVMCYRQGERVPVTAVESYHDLELSPDDKTWVTVEMVDIS